MADVLPIDPPDPATISTMTTATPTAPPGKSHKHYRFDNITNISSASSRVFRTPELLEMILLNLSSNDDNDTSYPPRNIPDDILFLQSLLSSHLTCQTFHNTIKNSPSIQEAVRRAELRMICDKYHKESAQRDKESDEDFWRELENSAKRELGGLLGCRLQEVFVDPQRQFEDDLSRIMREFRARYGDVSVNEVVLDAF